MENNNISDVIAPMMAITMELDVIIGSLLREEFEVSLADFKLLRAIFVLGCCTQLDIARFNQVTEAAVSKRITGLDKEGLIKKSVSKKDKRQSVLILTSKGMRLMKRLQSLVISNTELILKDFSETERKATTKLLFKILASVVEHSPNRDILLKSKHPVFRVTGQE